MKKTVDLSYPRPLCRRDSFINLNGEWDFVFAEGGAGEREPYQKVFPKDCLKNSLNSKSSFVLAV